MGIVLISEDSVRFAHYGPSQLRWAPPPTHVRGWTCLRNHFHILQQKPAKCWLLFMSLFVEEFEFVDVEGAADAAGEVVTEVGCAG
jgi:hypothetical protein